MTKPIIQTQVLPGSLASASYSTGAIDDPCTISVYCSINGPLPVKPRLELEDRAAIKCIWRSSLSSSTLAWVDNFTKNPPMEIDGNDYSDTNDTEDTSGKEAGKDLDLSKGFSSRSPREIEHILHGILSETLLTLLFPRSGFLFSFFLSKSGNNSSFHEILSCAINCLSVALIDSGIPIKFMIAASSFSIASSANSSVLLVWASNAPKDSVLAIDVIGGESLECSALTESLIKAHNDVNEALLEDIKAHFLK
ncbi:hypothetical protein MDAP_002317 [Mitosporidium daphniae]